MRARDLKFFGAVGTNVPVANAVERDAAVAELIAAADNALRALAVLCVTHREDGYRQYADDLRNALIRVEEVR